ncbi:MAG: hypothetical protein M1504_02560 [Candidatus Marsarchaeota archaeon]|nr:hypothetical protein [Candidatus Marsarchaeota archaeon]
MRIGIVSSMQNVDKMLEVRERLKAMGHDVFMTEFYEEMIGQSSERIEEIKQVHKNTIDVIRAFWKQMQNADAILVINLDKNGIKNYIGGNVLMEIGFAHVLNQKIFLWNPIPEIPHYKSEIETVKAIVINGDLSKIK